MADRDHRRAFTQSKAHTMVDVCDEARAYLLAQAVAADDYVEEHAWLNLAARVNQIRLHNLAKLIGEDQRVARASETLTGPTPMQVTRGHLVVTGG